MWRFLVLISAALAAEEAPAPAPAAAPAAGPKEWTCGPHVKEDAEALRRRVDALYADQRRLVAEVFPRGFKVKPRDPAWKSLTSSGAPDRRSWYRRTIGMWLPHKLSRRRARAALPDGHLSRAALVRQHDEIRVADQPRTTPSGIITSNPRRASGLRDVRRGVAERLRLVRF